MKKFLFALLALASMSSFASLNGLEKNVYKADNCPTCEVKFYLDEDNFLRADMINWGELGVDYELRIPVHYDYDRDILTIRNNSCAYQPFKDDNGIIQRIDVLSRTTNCPKSMEISKPTLTVDEETIKESLKKTVWIADNCPTCEVKFSLNALGSLEADLLNWGREGLTFAKALPVKMDTRNNFISIQSNQCVYSIDRNGEGEITQLLEVARLPTCPKTMIPHK